MTWEIILILVLLLTALTSFIIEKVSADVTAIVVFSVIIGVAGVAGSENWPTVEQLLLVFANPAPITIAAMFMVSAALSKCHAIDKVSIFLGRFKDHSYYFVLTILILFVAAISAVVNNTPVVVVFVPVVISLSRQMNIPSSKLLIPLSYASIFGGCCTLLGTSTNILGSSVLENSGLEPLSMFELSKIGAPLLVLGTIYLLVFAKRLLPVRETITSILTAEERKEYITEAYIRGDSTIIGKNLVEAGLMKKRGVRIIELIRNNVVIDSDIKKVQLLAGDRLILSCRPSGIAEARNLTGVDLVGEEALGISQISSNEAVIAEAVVSPTSSIISRTLREINFRQRYRVETLAIHRRGRNVREKLKTLRFQLGDTLLLMGTVEAIDSLRLNDDFILLDKPLVPAADISKKIPLVLGIILGMILLVSFGVLPIVAAAILAVMLLLLTDCLKAKDGYNSVQWNILVLIYGMLAMGKVMEATGASDMLAGFLGSLVTNNVAIDYQPYAMLAAIYLTTSILTEMLSNNATIVLMAPIAIGLAATLGVDPRPLVIATCIASSASFATPIGYQTNTYIYSVGGYRFRDFMKIGVPLNLLYFAVSLYLIPKFWAF